MNNRYLIAPIALLSLMAAITGCQSVSPAARPVTSRAELKDPSGRTVGSATLSEGAGGVRVIVEAAGLQPGEKGVHIHEVGRCEPPSFESAGNHFNPDARQHGLQNPKGPHAGDLPNIVIGADGRGRLDATTRRITLGAGASSVFDSNGSAIIVHTAPDDQMTDPSGNSGGRVACGVIVK
jgi:superoxide dismutase, Cu-Zn family